MPFRVIVAFIRAVCVFLATVWRVARQLFHEAAGAAFLLFAFAWGLAALREWRRQSAPWLVAVCVCFTVMMAAFSLTSFRDARRVR